MNTRLNTLFVLLVGLSIFFGLACKSQKPKPDSNLPVKRKPVIYLYPESQCKVELKLKDFGEFTFTYPKYDNGWRVTASPDGSLRDDSGNEYSYLFWEASSDLNIQSLETGFVVNKENVTTFLRDKLSGMGLTPKEYNEFIVYWAPLLQKNQFNFVHFITGKEYSSRIADLEITPVPDNQLRVFMVYKKLDESVNIKPQSLPKLNRKGFVLVEWGGGILDDDVNIGEPKL